MTLEVDIIIGQTSNQIKHLENKLDEEADRKKSVKQNRSTSTKKKRFRLGQQEFDMRQNDSNWKKIEILEKQMDNFVKIFSSKSFE